MSIEAPEQEVPLSAETEQFVQQQVAELEAEEIDQDEIALIRDKALAKLKEGASIQELLGETGIEAKENEVQQAFSNAYLEQTDKEGREGGGKLKEEYNIDHPERYPAAILSEMLQDTKDNKPWGIVIVAKHDHNGAFSQTSALENFHRDLKGQYRLRIIEAESAEVAKEFSGKLAEKNGKYSFGVLMAHGNSEGFQLNKGIGGDVQNNEESASSSSDEILEDGDSVTQFAEMLKEDSEESAHFVFLSCSTAKGNSPIAKDIAEDSERTIHAPDEDVYGADLNPSLNQGRIEMDPNFHGAENITFKHGNEDGGEQPTNPNHTFDEIPDELKDYTPSGNMLQDYKAYMYLTKQEEDPTIMNEQDAEKALLKEWTDTTDQYSLANIQLDEARGTFEDRKTMLEKVLEKSDKINKQNA